MSLAGRHVVLGVSGGIASYKACALARRLTEAGARVDVVMTASATEFIRPLTFEALTARPVVTSLWEPGRALDHVRLGREPELIIVAPATAQLLARFAQGMADDFLTALLLARRAPLLLCPAMNDAMWANRETQENYRRIRAQEAESGRESAGTAPAPVHILGPVTGPLAHGEGEGPGRMVEPEEICDHAERLLRSAPPFAGLSVVVTAGPTREALDPVRVITNRSSGRMGYALARAAWLRGAEVTLIAGPSGLEPPRGPALVRVETTEQLERAVAMSLPDADVLVMAAAPADFRSAGASLQKTRRGAGAQTLKLEPTPDVLAETAGRRRNGMVVVGFALETGDLVAPAREKLAAKRLDLVVANPADSAEAGPESPANRVTLVTREGADELPLLPKEQVAEVVLDRIASLLEARG